jgi:Ca2+/Na+ antiporter
MVILTVVTAGIYWPIWFMRRRKAINTMQAKEKLGSAVFILAIALFVISLLVAISAGVLEKGGGELLLTKGLQAFSGIMHAVAAAVVLVQSFKVRRIFNEHFNTHLRQDISFSVVATFFFIIYYLQYKINRLNRN